MFYDERIEAGRSNAFRKTMILATFLFIVHSLINGIVRYFTVSTFSFLDILVGTLCAIIGIAFILYGEICFRESDEMTEFQKNRYYTKAFFQFIYLIAGIYCILAPICIISNGKDNSPAELISFVGTPCWLFLLLLMKRESLPLNASFLADDPKVYRKRVLSNIIKFGAMCAFFTAISFVITFFYLLSTDKSNMFFSFFVLISILFSGLTVWISFSLEYLIFSIAERSSDCAKKKGIISAACTVFLFFGLLPLALNELITIATGILFGINSVKSVTIISLIRSFIAPIVAYFTGLFTVYFLSETQKLLKKLLTVAVIIQIINLICSYLLDLLTTFTLRAGQEAEIERLIYERLSILSALISLLFLAAGTIIVFYCLRVLSCAGYASGRLCAVPLIVFVVSTAELLLQRYLSDIIIIIYGLSFFTVILQCMVFLNVRSKIRNNPLPEN